MKTGLGALGQENLSKLASIVELAMTFSNQRMIQGC